MFELQKKMPRALKRAVHLFAFSGAFLALQSGCGGPGDFPTVAPLGQSLEFSTIVNRAISAGLFLIDSSFYGGKIVSDQAALDKVWEMGLLRTVTKPKLDFAVQTLVVWAESRGTPDNKFAISRLSNSQIILNEAQTCGVSTATGEYLLIAVVQGTVDAKAKFEFQQVRC
jgi:hypothetical protein